jgi:hypothetical protein
MIQLIKIITSPVFRFKCHFNDKLMNEKHI